MRQSEYICSKPLLSDGVPTDKTAFTENFMYKEKSWRFISISPTKSATFAYEEFFEGYVTLLLS